MNTKEIDFIHNIIADIDYLDGLGISKWQDPREIRQASVIIRRLVIDNELQ